MARTIWFLFAAIVLSVNLAYAAGGDTRESAVPASTKITPIEMVLVKGGCYQMGDTAADGGSEEKPVHEVCLDDFYLGKYEVTQGQWEKVMGKKSSADTASGDNLPVTKVNWNDVQDFISRLNSKIIAEKNSSGIYSLPTEAEWEYAARSGGKSEKFSGATEDVNSVAWFAENSDNQIKPVGTRGPNGLGIFDMSGNVWEWTKDWYGSTYYANSPRKNPVGPSSGDHRVVRGGSWMVGWVDVRTSYRNYLPPDYRSNSLGFRLLMTPPKKVK